MSQIRPYRRLTSLGMIAAWHGQGVMRRQQWGRQHRVRVLTQTIRTLQSCVSRLYHQIPRLSQFDSLQSHPTAAEMIRILVLHSTILYHWSLNEFHSPQVMLWIPWPHITHDLHNSLTVLHGYTELLLEGLYDPESAKLRDPDIDVFLKRCLRLCKQIEQSAILIHVFKFRDYDANTDTPLAPQCVASLVWSYLPLNRYCLFTAMPLTELPVLPPIIYNPSVVSDVFRYVVLMFAQDDDLLRHVSMRPRESPYGAEFCLTMRDYRLTDEAWDQVQQNSGAYDRLRELGGDIEPLTWDEGYGQGVVARLPWAKEDA